MMTLLLYGALFLFALLYALRALLMAGYDNQNLKYAQRSGNSIVKGWVQKMLQLKPITQQQLKPHSIDAKVHIRFQRKSTFYYYSLWICMFMILFLGAKIYLDAF